MFEGMDTNFGGYVATQGTAEKKGGARSRGHPLMPVTAAIIKDLLPGQDVVRFGSNESSEVTLVGVIRTAERKPNAVYIDYTVDDMTGPPVLVRQFMDTEKDINTIPIMENTYVRVAGRIRTFANERSITAFTVYPLKDLNDLTTHLLESVYCKLFYSKDVLRQREDMARAKSAQVPGGTTGGMAGMSSSAAFPKPFNQNVTSSGLTGINAEVHRFVGTSTTESGFHISEIQKRFPQLSAQKLRDILELLAGEGHMYTTVDDDHYKTTDS